MQNTTWIVVANASNARVFAQGKKNEPLNLIKELEHPESRKKISDLISDGAGRYRARDIATGNYASRTNPKRVEADHFAKELASFLEEGRKKNDYKALILAMPPTFQGMVKNHINHQLEHLIQETIPKDYHASTKKELTALFSNGSGKKH